MWSYGLQALSIGRTGGNLFKLVGEDDGCSSLHLETLANALPLEDAVRIELREGVPVFRAQPKIQDRSEELLEKQPTLP